MTTPRTIKLASFAAGFALLFMAETAAAQPDPFADYEQWKRTGGPPPEPPAAAEVPVDSPAPDANGGLSTLRSRQGSWMLGVRSQLSYTGANNELLSGVSESNRALFVRLTPAVGYFVHDRVRLGLALGLLSKSIANDGGDDSNESSFLMEATAHYTLPVGDRFSVVPGLGLGGYVGGGSRDLAPIGGASVTESTTTRGFSAALYLGAAYQLSPAWQIQTGFALNALLGSETIENTSLSTSTLHVGLPVEIHYTF